VSVAQLRPGERLGPYRLLAAVGQGATGLVFRAQAEDGAEVALKVLRPDRAGHVVARARFQREGRLAGRLASRHLVPILEVSEADGLSYLVMPYYAGGSLADAFRAHGPLPLDRTLTLAAELGQGLDSLHAGGVLHRDVKPSNVLLDEAGSAALADFGLALAEDWTKVTSPGQLLGTARYLAPELIEGAEATRESDLYALACVLYEAATGRPPFDGRDAAELAFAHLVEPPPDPRDLRPELPQALAEALVAALEKEPAARPTSGTALARMLHVARTAPPA
jgi:serine/threonine protein kinase